MLTMPNLLVLLLLAQSPSDAPATDSPDGELVITSDSPCPSADSVRQALTTLRPAADWPDTTVAIRAADQSLTIDLGSQDLGSQDTHQRRLAAGLDCAARAMSAALVIATWMDDLPDEVTGAPILRAKAPPPLSSGPAYQEIGVGLSTAVPGAWAPGGHAEFIRMRAEQDLGWQASIGLFAPRDIWVGNGVTHWMRATAAATVHARHRSKRPFAAADLGLALSFAAAWGTGYAENRSDRSVTWGPVAGIRAGIPWGRVRLWTDLRGWRWFHSESVQIDSTSSNNSTSAALPTWEGQWSLGVSYVLP